jgi:hypothetical protein
MPMGRVGLKGSSQPMDAARFSADVATVLQLLSSINTIQLLTCARPLQKVSPFAVLQEKCLKYDLKRIPTVRAFLM